MLDSRAVEAMISAFEDGAASIGIEGVRGSDASGIYYRVVGVGDEVIGLAVELQGGGTVPDEAVGASFVRSFPEGVLVVIDHYAGEFAFYVSENGKVRRASAVLSE